MKSTKEFSFHVDHVLTSMLPLFSICLYNGGVWNDNVYCSVLIATVHVFEYDRNTNGLHVELYSFSGEIGLWWWQKVVVFVDFSGFEDCFNKWGSLILDIYQKTHLMLLIRLPNLRP